MMATTRHLQLVRSPAEMRAEQRARVDAAIDAAFPLPPRAAARPASTEGIPTARDTVVERIDAAEQARHIELVHEAWRACPHLHPRTPGGTIMRVRVSARGRVGWWSDERGRRYIDRHASGQPWLPMPVEWVELYQRHTGGLEPDSAVINWYGPDDSLGWHADRTEADATLPIVTLSLGDAASWAIRPYEGGPTSRTIVESGDVTVLAGLTRSWEHSIERILPAPLFSPLRRRGRISVTLRVAGAGRRAMPSRPAPPPTAKPPDWDRTSIADWAMAEIRRLTGRDE